MAPPNDSISTFDKELAEALCNLEIPRKIRFSPNGKRIIYSTSLCGQQHKDKHPVSTLWLALTSTAASARQLTSGKVNDKSPEWLPDGNQIAFISDRHKPGESSAIWVMRLDGGDPWPITPVENEQAISAFAVSPDGKTIAYVSADEKSEEEKQKKKDGKPLDPDVWGEKWEYARLRLVDVATKTARTVVEGKVHVGGISWSPDGKRVAFDATENPNIEEAMITGCQISTVAIEGGDATPLCKTKVGIVSLVWGPDDKLYFNCSLPHDKDVGTRAIYSVGVDSPATSPTRVACGEDDTAEQLRVAGNRVLVNREVRLASVISDLEGPDIFKDEAPFANWDAYVDEDSKETTIAVSLSSASKPFEIFIISKNGERLQISDHGAPLKDQSFGEYTVLTSQSSDGEVELEALFLTPTSKAGLDGKPKEPMPTAVLIHGGPTSRVGPDFLTCGLYWSAYLVARGYGVLLPNYRGSTGRGEKFAMYSYGGVGKYDYEDIVSITDDAIKKGFADSKKLVVGGWSQGGLLSYMCSARNGLHDLGWRFNATICGAGISDLESLAMTSDMGSTFEAELNGGRAPWTLSRDDTRNRQGSALWEVAHAVEESRRRGDTVIPPMLVLHGENDVRCPLSQAEGYRRALRAHNLPYEFVVYPGQPHGPKPQVYWMDILERLDRWCHTYIGEGSEGH